jgi:hypothetical protein
MVEKDLNKFFRKKLVCADFPLKGIQKKRGTNYAFLQFECEEQKKRFEELFASDVA